MSESDCRRTEALPPDRAVRPSQHDITQALVRHIGQGQTSSRGSPSRNHGRRRGGERGAILHARDTKGPSTPPAPVQSFVNRAGTTWELGSRLQQPERKRRRFNLAARRSLTLSGTLRVCWPNEWPLFVSFLPPLYFLCQESETAALMMCVCVSVLRWD